MVRQSSISKTTTHIYQMHYVLFLEESLGQLDVVQVQLAKDEQDLQNEITQLQEELRLQQDPGRMQLIQEMISVRLDAWSLAHIRLFFDSAPGSFGTDVSHPRKGHRIRSHRPRHYQRYSSP